MFVVDPTLEGDCVVVNIRIANQSCDDTVSDNQDPDDGDEEDSVSALPGSSMHGKEEAGQLTDTQQTDQQGPHRVEDIRQDFVDDTELSTVHPAIGDEGSNSRYRAYQGVSQICNCQVVYHSD